MKSWTIHYMNKYPGGYAESDDNTFRVYNEAGKLVVLVQKGGDGQWHDQSESMGLEGRHDLAPIPKDARVFKMLDGKVSRDELADEREQLASEFMRNGRVASCSELTAEGFNFCDKQRVIRRPEAKAAAAESKKGSKKRA